MIRLSDDLARRRMVYPRPLPAVPDVMVIDVGEPYRNPSLPLGRYYPIMVENEDELAEFERFLAVERAEAVAPDLLDRRPSQIVSDEVLTCRFDPPAEGWPWITLFRWPPGFQEAASRHGVDMARGCYTIELADSQSEADLGAIAVLEQLAARHETELRLLAADLMAIGGRA